LTKIPRRRNRLFPAFVHFDYFADQRIVRFGVHPATLSKNHASTLQIFIHTP
jgi:hypothetical protein